MFSSYYAWSGRADPENHVCLNVALYGDGGNRWTMTERGRRSLRRTPDTFEVGPSAVSWDGETLVYRLAERGAPLPRAVCGEVRVRPEPLIDEAFTLDARGRHVWAPLAPAAAIEVDLERPKLRWRGRAYLDSNRGSEPLEAGFRRWHWARAHIGRGTAVLYDVEPRDGEPFSTFLRFGADGRPEELPTPPVAGLPTTLWRVGRRIGADAGTDPAVVRTLEDSPFYARSLVETTLLGEMATAVHESLSLDRFARGWVKVLLPFRMPRITW
ncbi:hydratase [Amorphus orientalis]|uniref:Carotenoid 1,2-hydratase n=1 Tax=Amorphus orientalis TaxID=649198 RepID=A0AAE3VPQ3_9HYPH|nr:hydratase [Amorphus orientalis]MDQ0315486.1 carotenoid 1,2-hydratase [Amorphus orientalis]